MISYQEMRNANLDENRRMLQELGVKIPSASDRPVFKKSKLPSKQAKPPKIPDSSELDSNEKKGDENDQPTLRSSFRVRLKTKQYYHDDNYIFDAPRTKVPRVRPENKYGSIEGVEVGREWATRMDCSYDLVHRPTVAGIHGGPEGAYSVALSGGYEDDIDLGESFTYTGEGGRDLKGTATNPKNLRTAAQSKDQTLDRGNLALSISVDTQNPVRVIRGYKLDSPYAPEEGYRYDGLYLVKKFWVARGKSGFKVFKFAFVRCDPEPAPWTNTSIENILKVRSPASPSTPTSAPSKDLEACEAPSLEASESEDLTHLEEASKGATEPGERPSSKKRVSFYTKDSVRLFESEAHEEESEASDSETEVPSGVVTRRSSKAQALDAEGVKPANSRESERNDTNIPGTATSDKTSKMNDSSPKPGVRTKGLKNSPRSTISPKSDIASRNKTLKHSDEESDGAATKSSKNNSSKTSKASKSDSVSPKFLGLRSKLKSPNSSLENTQGELAKSPKDLLSDSKQTKHDSVATEDKTHPVFIRKSKRSPKPTEKIKSPGDYWWMKKSPKREEGNVALADNAKAKISPKVSEQKISGNSGSSKEGFLSGAEKKSLRDNLRSKQSPSVTSIVEEKAGDDTPKFKKPPVSSADERFSDSGLKSKKSPKIGAEKGPPDDTAKSKRSPKFSSEEASSEDTEDEMRPKIKERSLNSRFKKSPKVSAKKRSSEDFSKPKKSPKSSSAESSSEDTPKPKKSPKLSAESRSSGDISKPKKSPKSSSAESSSEDTPKPKKSPKLRAESKSSGDISKPKKSPKSSSAESSSEDTPKPKKSPKLSAESRSSGDISKPKKSPKSSSTERSSDDTPKAKKSPKLSIESKGNKTPVKQPKAINSAKSTEKKAQNDIDNGKLSVEPTVSAKKSRGRPPTHGRYSAKDFPVIVSATEVSQSKISKSKSKTFPTDETESPSKPLKAMKSPKAVKSEARSQKPPKSPNKISDKSPSADKLAQKKLSSQSVASKSSKISKKTGSELSAARKKLLKKIPKSPSVSRAASILSRAKAPKPISTFQKKLALIAQARAKAQKMSEKPPKKVKKASKSNDSVSTLKGKPKTKSSQKEEPQLTPEKSAKAIKRSASPDASPRKKSRVEPKKSPSKKARTSEGLEPMEVDSESPPTLQRYDEEQRTRTSDADLRKKNASPDSPSRIRTLEKNPDLAIPSSPERRMSNSSVPSSPPWSPVGSPSPQGKLLSKTRSSPKKQETLAASIANESFDDDELLGMMQFSLCPCSGDGNSKVTIKMVDGKWIEVIQPAEDSSSAKEGTDSNVKTDHCPPENIVNSSPNLTDDLISAPEATR